MPQHTPSVIRTFKLQRDGDVSGVSGTGIVAEGAEFTNGMVAMTWLSPHPTVTVFANMRTLDLVHGHEGRTHVVFNDSPESVKMLSPDAIKELLADEKAIGQAYFESAKQKICALLREFKRERRRPEFDEGDIMAVTLDE